MRGPHFVKQNSKNEQALSRTLLMIPKELADRFIKITDDLAYAQTFHPQIKTGVVVHL
ncbi:hypothetical protein AB6735_25935 [Mucilaginibacter sp. RCC_168]